jgi:hypothetical protein
MPEPEVPAAEVKPEGNTPAVETPAATPVAAVVPDSYTIALPDGSILSPKAIERASEIAKSLKLTNDADAQSVLGLADEMAREVIATYEAARQPDGAAHKALVAQFTVDALAHPKLGNGNSTALEQKALNAGLVLDQFNPNVKAVLRDSGLLAHPEVLILLNAQHAAMQESALATGNLPVKALGGYKALFPDGIPDDVGASTARP